MAKEAVREKDPGTAVLISIVCMFLFGAPSLGHVYLGNVRKGVIYLILTWLLGGITLAVYFISAFITMPFTLDLGFIIFLPVFIIPLLFNLIVVWDVYLIANGRHPKLPEI